MLHSIPPASLTLTVAPAPRRANTVSSGSEQILADKERKRNRHHRLPGPMRWVRNPGSIHGCSERGSHGSWLPSWSGACSGSIPEGSMLSTIPIEAAADTIQDTSKGAGSGGLYGVRGTE